MKSKIFNLDKKSSQFKLSEEHILYVKKIFDNFDIDIPFFISGGSVFSILNSKKINSSNDIDIYFYSQNDFDKIKERFSTVPEKIKENILITENSWNLNLYQNESLDLNFSFPNVSAESKLSSFEKLMNCGKSIFQSKNTLESKFKNRPVQFIIKSFGTPEETFKTFDFNCSRCCITSNLDLIVSEDFSKHIIINDKKIGTDTFNRYQKYVETKGAIDNNDVTIKKIINYLIINRDLIAKRNYNHKIQPGQKAATNINVLMRYLASCHSKENAQYLHDQIVKLVPKNEHLKIFEIMSGVFMNLFKYSDELLLFKVLTYEKESANRDFTDKLIPALTSIDKNFYNHNSKQIEIVRNKYPEYFI